MGDQFKQVYISDGVLRQHGAVAIAQEYNVWRQGRRAVGIGVRTLSRDEGEDMKLHLLIQAKNRNEGEKPLIYVVCTVTELPELRIQQETACILAMYDLEQEVKDLRLEHARVFILVRSLYEGFTVVAMSQDQLQKRYKMQAMLRKTQAKYQDAQNRQQIRVLASLYNKLNISKTIRQLTRWVDFAGRRRMLTLRKYFTQLAIHRLCSQIDSHEAELVAGRYLTPFTCRSLLSRSFHAWKHSLRLAP